MNGSFRSSRGDTWRRLLIPLAFGLIGALAVGRVRRGAGYIENHRPRALTVLHHGTVMV